MVGISHELRSPLNAILGYAQLLERDNSISARWHDGIGIIRRSGEHLAGLIEGLLDISKIEAGRIEIDRDPVPIEEFLRQLVSMFRLQAEAKGIGFTFTRPDRMPAVVYTDERRLRQILINLLSNAMKFTRAGEVHLGLRWRSEIAEIVIEDTGIGIAEADLGRIFEPFERVEQPDASGIHGVGLGLTITKLLTQILGGELTVTSTPGVGTRFCVRLMLPEARGRHLAAAPERRLLGYQGARLTVLIADDDPVHRGLMEDLLSPLGFVLFSAPSCPACIDVALQCQPDLLLLDISMPGLDGWTVAERLRRMGFERLKIVVISANAAELRRPPGATSYHDDFMVKPVGLSDLMARIGTSLAIEWNTQAADVPLPDEPLPDIRLNHQQTAELRQLLSIGYVHGIHSLLNSIEEKDPEKAPRVALLRRFAANFQLDQLRDALGPEMETE